MKPINLSSAQKRPVSSITPTKQTSQTGASKSAMRQGRENSFTGAVSQTSNNLTPLK